MPATTVRVTHSYPMIRASTLIAASNAFANSFLLTLRPYWTLLWNLPWGPHVHLALLHHYSWSHQALLTHILPPQQMPPPGSQLPLYPFSSHLDCKYHDFCFQNDSGVCLWCLCLLCSPRAHRSVAGRHPCGPPAAPRTGLREPHEGSRRSSGSHTPAPRPLAGFFFHFTHLYPSFVL